MTFWRTATLWMAFIFAVLLTNLIKIARQMREQAPDKHRSFLEAVGDFFVGDSKATISSITVIAVEWILGAVYIDRLGFGEASWLMSIPQHPAIACLLGSLAEGVAPLLVKPMVKRLFPD